MPARSAMSWSVAKPRATVAFRPARLPPDARTSYTESATVVPETFVTVRVTLARARPGDREVGRTHVLHRFAEGDAPGNRIRVRRRTRRGVAFDPRDRRREVLDFERILVRAGRAVCREKVAGQVGDVRIARNAERDRGVQVGEIAARRCDLPDRIRNPSHRPGHASRSGAGEREVGGTDVRHRLVEGYPPGDRIRGSRRRRRIVAFDTRDRRRRVVERERVRSFGFGVPAIESRLPTVSAMSCPLAKPSVTVPFRFARLPPDAVTSQTESETLVTVRVTLPAPVPVTVKSDELTFATASSNDTRQVTASALVGEVEGVRRSIFETDGAALSSSNVFSFGLGRPGSRQSVARQVGDVLSVAEPERHGAGECSQIAARGPNVIHRYPNRRLSETVDRRTADAGAGDAEVPRGHARHGFAERSRAR